MCNLLNLVKYSKISKIQEYELLPAKIGVNTAKDEASEIEKSGSWDTYIYQGFCYFIVTKDACSIIFPWKEAPQTKK